MIHLIHGIRTAGPSPIEGLVPYLSGCDVRYPDYGWIAAVETRIVNPIIVGTLAPYVGESDILICHSNGCAIGYDLMNRGIKVGGAIFINAALEQSITLPAGCPWIDVYWNEGDEITEAAKIGAELGLTDLVWGEMGHAGPISSNPNIVGIDCAHYPGAPVVLGHSDFFQNDNLKWWAPFLTARMHAHIGH